MTFLRAQVLYMNSKSDLILNFIEQFRELGAENCFANGMCYWFAHILQARFAEENPYIMYAPIANHFFCKIDDKYYDIQGEYHPKEKIHYWIDYDKVDWLETLRIIRDCVDKCPAGTRLCGHCTSWSIDDWGCGICDYTLESRYYNDICDVKEKKSE